MINPFRSTALRIGLTQAGAGILALALLASALWWTTTARLNGELNARVREDTRNIAALIYSSGTPAALRMIEGRVGAELDEDEILLLVDPSLRRLAGNLPAWPVAEATGLGRHHHCPGWARQRGPRAVYDPS